MPEEKKRILIVDDEVDFVKSTSLRLSFEGFETMEACSSDEAIAMMKDVVPDIILLDIMMPGMNGVDLYKRLRKDKRTNKVPVIFLTVWDQLVPQKAKRKGGPTLLVTKPFEFDFLIKTIREALARSEDRGGDKG